FFFKDVKGIKDSKLKETLEKVILVIKSSESLNERQGLVKMKSYDNAYRLRIGNYRLGLFIEGDTVEVARLLKRNDIYKLFL
ncbi:MAG: mRNA interferase RelE/StbE, partial [Arcticibacterium sp.]